MEEKLSLEAGTKKEKEMDYNPEFEIQNDCDNGKMCGEPVFVDLNSELQKPDLIWMQYTGFDDVNQYNEKKKGIYEGDIVKTRGVSMSDSNLSALNPPSILKEPGKLGIIWHSHGDWIMTDYLFELDAFDGICSGEVFPHSLHSLTGNVTYLEVIGNIYENPEMLECENYYYYESTTKVASRKFLVKQPQEEKKDG